MTTICHRKSHQTHRSINKPTPRWWPRSASSIVAKTRTKAGTGELYCGRNGGQDGGRDRVPFSLNHRRPPSFRSAPNRRLHLILSFSLSKSKTYKGQIQKETHEKSWGSLDVAIEATWSCHRGRQGCLEPPPSLEFTRADGFVGIRFGLSGFTGAIGGSFGLGSPLQSELGKVWACGVQI